MDGAGSCSVAHRAGLLPTELTGMWGWILLRSPHQGRGGHPQPTPPPSEGLGRSYLAIVITPPLWACTVRTRRVVGCVTLSLSPPRRVGGVHKGPGGGGWMHWKGGGGGSPPCVTFRRGVVSLRGPWTVTRSSLRMLRRVAAFCRPLRPVLLLVSFPRSRSPVVGVPGLCWRWRDVPFARQQRPIIGVLRVVLVVAGVV